MLTAVPPNSSMWELRRHQVNDGIAWLWGRGDTGVQLEPVLWEGARHESVFL